MGSESLSGLFGRWKEGDEKVLDDLLPRVYDELRSLAEVYLRGERPGHTLQPTALVNEAFVRLLGTEVVAGDRSHFFSLAARAMRRVLVDHARHHRAARRFSPEARVTLNPDLAPGSTPTFDALALHEALERFAEIAPRPAQLVELRYFGGLTEPEAALALGVSEATVRRDWKAARAWLRRELEA